MTNGSFAGLPKSFFTERIVLLNSIGDRFYTWSFQPGMLFGSEEKWWDDGHIRSARHEGLDLCFYLDRAGEKHRLGSDTLIPPLFDGRIVLIVPDFLGMTLFLEHNILRDDGRRLITAYGHLARCEDSPVGHHVSGEEPLGLIADTTRCRRAVPPHLHLSVAWASPELRSEHLSWEAMKEPTLATLVDPLRIVATDSSYFLNFSSITKR